MQLGGFRNVDICLSDSLAHAPDFLPGGTCLVVSEEERSGAKTTVFEEEASKLKPCQIPLSFINISLTFFH